MALVRVAPVVVVDVIDIRSSASRWRDLALMLAQLQRLAQVSAVIDSEGRGGKQWGMNALMFEEGAGELEQVIDAQVSRLTVELLQAELARKKRKDGGKRT